MEVKKQSRNASMVSVPLFLMLSGYLLKNRQPTRQYYFKLVRILGIYGLTSICCYLYRYFTGAKAVSGNILELVAMILNFRAAPYSWYVEMYIGLFLLIITALPGITNGICEILPDWWLMLYPVMYYYFGAYLREYPLKMKELTNFAGTAAVVLAVGVVNILLSYNTSFTNADVRKLFNISSATANRILSKFTDEGKLQIIRIGRSWGYQIQ